MHRCIADSPVSVAVAGIGYTVWRGMDDIPDDHPLLKVAGWAFEPVDPPEVRKARRSRRDEDAGA